MDIVVADDDDELRAILTEVLRDEGYDVVGVSAGDRLIELLSVNRPRLLLLDLSMPALDLDATMRLLRAPDRPGATCVVALSGAERLDEVALRHGFDGALRKPVELEFLLRLAARAGRMPDGRDSAPELA